MVSALVGDRCWHEVKIEIIAVMIELREALLSAFEYRSRLEDS